MPHTPQLKMKTISIVALFITTICATTFAPIIYEALRSEDIETVDTALNFLSEQEESITVKAYTGTLLMKRAEFLGSPGKKLDSFKEGHALLEEAIAQDPNNAELRFLRLSIQENAPKILTYFNEIDEDKAIVIKHYKDFNKELQAYVRDYAKNSEVLSLDDLKK